MSSVVIASNEQDAGVGPRLVERHAELAGGLSVRIDAVIRAAEAGDAADLAGLAEYVRLIGAHLDSAESSTIAVASTLPDVAPVAATMTENLAAARTSIAELTAATSAVRAAAAGGNLLSTFSTHVSLADEYLMPALASAPTVSLADVVGSAPELLGEGADQAANEAAGTEPDGHVCACGVVDGPELPELDARSIPHAIRHSTIFGALDAVKPGDGMILVAPHDPLPLLDQLEARAPGQFAIDYIERGPEAWRLQFVRIHD
ncbi:DUF2249 domain-containing protein [Spelaeicoccus albus]|uniref:Uncharacterized protein (DUF2249 family) n=1 Tax=Spelaeicoccus albus TaxID=1280376 RepID=A0A7Z0IHD3_9MICO|nr:DUF2249 domain-containing protein [Spelaeicoccus albus]NYI67639.1 uncharacterized protein (DUF2249 family) [Spelaeicoccus albus]